MHGGFDSHFNHSGTKFLLADSNDNLNIHILPNEINGPSPRGYHSAVYVPMESNSKKRIFQSNQVFIFGGQCCSGGPYDFYNDVYRFDLGTMTWHEVHCSGDIPCHRSQCYSFYYRGHLYVYGGYDGKNIFTDLHTLDLKTMVWEKLNLHGHDRPTGLKGLSPLDFHIYFCRPAGILIGRRLVILSEQYEVEKAAIFTLDLKTLIWRRLRGHFSVNSKGSTMYAPFDPPAIENPTLTLTKGQLLMIGGRIRSPKFVNQPSHLYPWSRIWTISLPKCLDWSQERLLWLACYKNDRDECNLAKCPPHVMYKIIGYVNSNTFYIK